MNSPGPRLTRVLMIRETLDEIPAFSFPPGFSMRWYEPGDERLWVDIHKKADTHNTIGIELFRQQFGADDKLIAQRQCYLINAAGEAIGTATAWRDENLGGASIGRVHWVAIVPAYQGCGLSKPLMTTVCERLRDLGHTRAYLATALERKPAIRLYLRFGFVPWIRSEEESLLWQRGV
jgi:GNAT superfamily N-acetyltransferase